MVKSPYVKIGLRFGLVCAALVLLYFFTFYFLGENPLRNLSTFDILIELVSMTFAMGYYRDRINRGSMHFWEGLVVGNLTNFIGVFLAAVAIYIFIAFIDTELLPRHITEMQEFLRRSREAVEDRFGGNAYEQTLKNIAATTPIDIALDVFIKNFFISFFASGIIAAILRRQRQ